MHFNKLLDNILGQKSKVKILRYLVQYQGDFTGREIARACNISHPIAHKALSDLKDEGVIIMRKVGNCYLYSLAIEHELIKEIILPLFTKENKLLQKVTQILVFTLKNKIESIILYGSIVSGKEKAQSDIDLLIISKKIKPEIIEKKILEINPKILIKFGNQISPLIMTKSDFWKKFKKKDKLIAEIVKKGKILYGKSISELIIGKNG